MQETSHTVHVVSPLRLIHLLCYLYSVLQESGLSLWIGNSLSALGSLSPPLLMLCLCLIVAAATELTTNAATASLILPIIADLVSSSHYVTMLAVGRRELQDSYNFATASLILAIIADLVSSKPCLQ